MSKDGWREVVDSGDQIPVAGAEAQKGPLEAGTSEPITRFDDAVRTYLLEIGRINFQDVDRGTELAMRFDNRIYQSKWEMSPLVFSCNSCLRAFLKEVRRVEKGQVPLEDFIPIYKGYSKKEERKRALEFIRKARIWTQELERLSRRFRDGMSERRWETLQSKNWDMRWVAVRISTSLGIHSNLLEKAVEHHRERLKAVEEMDREIQDCEQKIAVICEERRRIAMKGWMAKKKLEPRLREIEEELKEHPTKIAAIRRKVSEIEYDLGQPLEDVRQILESITYSEEAVQRVKREMVDFYMPLVISMAKSYANYGLEYSDLIREGSLGLMKAVDKFKWIWGYKFLTYAIWWISQAITRAIADQALTIRKLVQELGREPTPEEIAERLEMPADHVKSILKVAQESVSLDDPIGEDVDNNFGDFVENPTASSPALTPAANLLLKCHFEQVLATLTEIEAQVVRLRFGIGIENPFSLKEVGEKLKQSPEYIQQIEAKALHKLKYPRRSQRLREYAEGVG